MAVMGCTGGWTGAVVLLCALVDGTGYVNSSSVAAPGASDSVQLTSVHTFIFMGVL